MMKNFFVIVALASVFLSVSSNVEARNANCTYSRQVRVLALNIYHEARGESRRGQQMVGEVTLNRVRSSNYPNNICAVVYQRNQFSWTRNARHLKVLDQEQWNSAQEIARKLISGRYRRISNGATHFFNPQMVEVRPNWSMQYTRIARVGNHVFYRQS